MLFLADFQARIKDILIAYNKNKQTEEDEFDTFWFVERIYFYLYFSIFFCDRLN